MKQINNIADVCLHMIETVKKKEMDGIRQKVASKGCPVCGTTRAMRMNLNGEGIMHDYKPQQYSAQFDPSNYICENGHEFRVDEDGKII